MILDERYELSNGVLIPKMGLGTWFINNKDVVGAVQDAAKAGYRLIDTAQAYGNEAGVGEGIRTCGVKREEMFVTTKVAAEAKSYKKATSSIDKSLKKMGLDYIDMIIIHSPQPWTKFRESEHFYEENKEVWRALEDAYQVGKVRAIGVSNFEQADLQNILTSCKVKPMVNQILAHISNTPLELIQYTQEQGILVEAYSPVAHGVVLQNPELKKMALKYGVTVAQLCIKYDLQLGLLPLPKTTNINHMRNNSDLDFEISANDMETLKNVEKIKDYGNASAMPVFGGKLNFKAMMAMLFHNKK